MNEEKTNEPRRSFLIKLSLGLSAIPAAIAAVPILSALLAPLLEKKTQQWRKVGALTDFPAGTTNLVKFENADPVAWAGVTAKTAAWLRHDEHGFTCFSANCTHLGCPVRWEAKAELFMCPCHGGVYYRDGSVAAGPPPKHLVQYPVRVSKNNVEIMTSPVPITNITADEKKA